MNFQVHVFVLRFLALFELFRKIRIVVWPSCRKLSKDANTLKLYYILPKYVNALCGYTSNEEISTKVFGEALQFICLGYSKTGLEQERLRMFVRWGKNLAWSKQQHTSVFTSRATCTNDGFQGFTVTGRGSSGSTFKVGNQREILAKAAHISERWPTAEDGIG